MNDEELAELRGRYKPKTMNDEQLAEIRARCEAATPGPWEVHEDRVSGMWVDRSVWAGIEGVCGDIARVNADFIAAAREDVPALLDEVERLRHVYAIFEEMAPPDLPRDMFARGCFAAWEGMDAKNHRIEQLEAALRQYAADANWMAVETGPFGATDDAWMGEGEGWYIARKVLEVQP